MASWLTGFHSTTWLKGRRSLVGLAILATSVLAAICATSAPAATSYSLQNTIFVNGLQAGSIAVDSASGDYYVAVSGGLERVERFSAGDAPAPFSAAGDPEKPYIEGNALTGSPTESFYFDSFGATQVAVDNSGGPFSGDVYVTDTNHHAVDVFDSSGTYRGRLDLEAAGPQTGVEPCGVAIDAAGTVYVSNSGGHIDAFTPGPKPEEAQFAGQISSSQFGLCGLAVDGSGNLYVGSYFSGPIRRYSTADLGSSNPTATQLDPNGTAVAVDPIEKNVFVDKGDRIATYSAAGDPGLVFGESTLSSSRGVAVSGANGHAYVSMFEQVLDFAPIAVPDATTGGATVSGRTSATVAGAVDPAGSGTIVECRFEYGLGTSYGQSVPCAPAAPYSSPTEVSAELTGLSDGTKYHYRVVAANSQGDSPGQDRTFTTIGNLNPAPGSPHPAGTNPFSSAIGDLNGDGDPDLAVGNLGSGDVTVLLGDGNGGFTPAPSSPFAAAAGAGAVAIGDVDGDGDPDLAVTANQANEIVILLGDGSGGFTPGAGPFPVGTGPYPAALGDLDGDGDLDLAVPNNSSGGVSILLGDGSGGFEPAPGGTLPTGAGPDSVAIGDLDGDGDPDLAVGDVNAGDITILLGNGSGGFSPAPNSPLATGVAGGAVSIVDLDGDGDPDLAGLAFNQSNNERGLVALLGDGSGGFADPEVTWNSGTESAVRVAFGDLDGDGFSDAVTANGAAGKVGVSLGDGAGGFEIGLAGSTFESGLFPITATIGDLDADGKPDVVASNFASNDVTVFLNDFGPPVLLPHATTGGSAGVTRTEATLQGAVDPAGNGVVTECRFEWGTSTFYGESAPCSPAAPYSTPAAVSAQLSGLSAGVTYHFRIVAANANGVRRGHDHTLTTVGAVAGLATEPATDVDSSGATLHGAFEGEGLETSYHFEYGTTSFYGNSTPSLSAGSTVGPIPISAEIEGLESSTTYHFRVVAENSEGQSAGADRVFTTTGRPQLEATTEVPLNTGRTEAFVAGRAYPSVAGDVTGCNFEYGTTASYGQSVPCAPEPPYSSPEFVVGLITGLTPSTEYHYRVAISNGVESAAGEDLTLTTKGPGPEVQTFEATEITEISAAFNGSYEGTGEQTYVYFEYGTTTSYGRYTTPPPGGDAGSPTGFQFYSSGIGQGLRPNTTYHYRIVAGNPQGTTYGNDVEFTTPGFDLDGETGLPSNITATSATVSGEVDPLGGGPITECHFDYGTTIAMEQTAPCAPAGPYAAPANVSADLTGLQPGTFYFYRLAASNGHASIVRGRHALLTLSAENSASESIPAGGTVSTNSTTTPDDPTGTAVTTPVPGVVTIDEGPISGPEPSGYTLLGEQVQISAPAGTVANPLVIHFVLDGSLLPPGVDSSNVQVFRNGTAVPACSAESGASATPDPCVAARNTTGGGGVDLVIRTSEASTWNFGLLNPPETTITSGPSGPTRDAKPTFTFTSSSAGATFQCRFDGEGFRACRGPGAKDSPAGALADGPHAFEVRAIDSAGNPDPSPASASFTVDTHAPETTIDSGPSGYTTNTSPNFTFSSNEPAAGFECNLDSAGYAPCFSPLSPGPLAEGGHNLKIRATDAAGNVDKTPAAASFTVDSLVPETTIKTGPVGPTKDARPSFTFSSSESGSSFQCRFDGEGFRACSGPGAKDTPASALADGPHSFEVRAIDKAGNVDPSPASASFTVDTHVPETTIDSGPSGNTTNSSPTFTFSSNEPAAGFECSLDSAPYAVCSSPKQVGPLAKRAHTFRVRAKDAAGNVDKTPATAKFTVK